MSFFWATDTPVLDFWISGDVSSWVSKPEWVLPYRLGPVTSKSFIGKFLLRIKWKFELQHEAIVKTFDL